LARHATQHRGQLRIIAGRWRGRKLALPDVAGVRPTPDRVRETLFNWLAPVLPGARCLDLFAGSGALGLEALSRGAAEVVMIERDPRVVRALEDHARLLQARGLRIVVDDGMRYLDAPAPVAFDIVFLDPPFGQGLLTPCCAKLEAGSWLAPEARIYLEAERSLGVPAVPPAWEVVRSRQAGQVGYHLALRHVRAAAENH
jgi:16S rRNA (guanine966-N2)-methyltransferase